MASRARPRAGDKLHELLDSMNCGLLEADADRDLTFVNARLCEWLGYELEELVGRPGTHLLPEELRELMDAEREATMRGDIRARLVVMQRKDSTTFPAILLPQPLFDEAGRYAGGVMVVVELGTIETAKPVGPGAASDIRTELSRIALQIQSLKLSAAGGTARVPFEHPALRDLSEREREVVGCLLGGDRVPRIAEKLFISPHTVRNHLKSVFRKVGASNQSQLIEWVRELRS